MMNDGWLKFGDFMMIVNWWLLMIGDDFDVDVDDYECDVGSTPSFFTEGRFYWFVVYDWALATF